MFFVLRKALTLLTPFTLSSRTYIISIYTVLMASRYYARTHLIVIVIVIIIYRGLRQYYIID